MSNQNSNLYIFPNKKLLLLINIIISFIGIFLLHFKVSGMDRFWIFVFYCRRSLTCFFFEKFFSDELTDVQTKTITRNLTNQTKLTKTITN